jgi:ATP-dependent Clp protease adaptor protein ClpS
MTDTDISIDEKIKKTTKLPSKYKVVFLNDDTTPMDWVIKILIEVFKHSSNSAEQLTISIHNEGSAVVGIYSHEIAEQKMEETVSASRNYGFPLQVTIEEDE